MKRVHNNSKFLELREKYPYFEFQSYSFQTKNKTLEAEFCFNISGKHFFKPTLKFQPRAFYQFGALDRSSIENLIFNIGLVELISYWKTTCSPEIIICPHTLDEDQINWWKKLYFYGLGEFFYLNDIHADFDSFVKIITNGSPLNRINSLLNEENVIIPIGGGKDSVVTLETIKRQGLPMFPMVLNPREASVRTIETAGYSKEQSIIVDRTIDPHLIKMNAKGYLNGHTPFSALLAFINALAAAGTGSKYIALSNESSASESTIPGTKINHQYSKSLEFEEDFITYLNSYIHAEMQYFSFLRPVNELQIAKIFSGYKEHFNSFRSCNAGSKTDSWCGKCPKCLFTFIILTPFINNEDLQSVFGKNLLDDPELDSIFDELTGKAAIKPFECIGTPEEVRVALWKLDADIISRDKPFLLHQFIESFPQQGFRQDYLELLNQFDTKHFLPDRFEDYLKLVVRDLNSSFKSFLKNRISAYKSICIAGFGKEGRSTYRLLRDLFPKTELCIADRNKLISMDLELAKDDNIIFYLGDNYLEKIDSCDIIIKSPGVKLTNNQGFRNSNITSQTDLFLQYYHKQTIGVTGTKGKSTTASLIQHILEKSGTKSILLGNIGKPPFDGINEIDNSTTVVFELSGHQLEYLSASPHISILLNIFPEHLDHFNDFEQYKNAKSNIARYQKAGDVLIKSESITELLTAQNQKVLVFGKQSKLDAYYKDSTIHIKSIKQAFHPDKELLLAGEHNILNMLAAILAVAEIGVSLQDAIKSITAFTPLPHRLEYVGRFGEIDFYNDSISTVPESTIAAVKTVQNIDTLILGGFDRGLDYKDLIDFLRSSEVSNFIFLGKAGEKMLPLFVEAANSTQKCFFATDLNEGFNVIKKYTKKGSACLLSPAAASYDQFHNFEHRGDTFKALAKNLV